MTQRLFTQAELDALCLSGEARFTAALASGDKAQAQAVYKDNEKAFREFHDIYTKWVATILEFLYERHGHEAMAKALPLEKTIAGAFRMGMTLEEVLTADEAPQKRMAGLIDAGDVAGAKAFYTEVERACRDLHDLYREWVTAGLSHVYREYGVEELNHCLRYSSEKGWMPWMMEDVSHDVQTRLRDWTRLLVVGNFATLSITEDDEKFLITQNPCGSCGRQHSDGRYDPPWNLAVIKEKNPITFTRGDVTAYRTHIAVMHTIMPIERIGAPWPVIQCSHAKEIGRAH
ncbi:MAG: hypothetical protein AB7G75_24515, partial [Candidatus Binatia bacterium]